MQAEFLQPPEQAPTRTRETARKERFALRTAAGAILGPTLGRRVGRCGFKLVGAQAIICEGARGAYVAGVETCGSVWTCAVCAGKIAEGRRAEVAEALDGHAAARGHVFMVALTIPHQHYEAASQLRRIVSEGWRKLIAGAGWKGARARWGIEGYIRALEITRGDNGWHPHIHALMLTRALSEDEAEAFRIFMVERWAAIIERIGGRLPSRVYGVDFRRAENPTAAGDYVAKWGVDSEVAKASTKISKKGGRSPWQLLADADAGDARARILFREYAKAFKGARHLTWSRGLRDLYVKTPELSDEDLVRADAPHRGDAVLGTMGRILWFRVKRAGVVADLLTAAEAEGWPGVLKLLRARGLAIPIAVEHDETGFT